MKWMNKTVRKVLASISLICIAISFISVTFFGSETKIPFYIYGLFLFAFSCAMLLDAYGEDVDRL